jgi:Leucine-rich repeat (LRR) protein
MKQRSLSFIPQIPDGIRILIIRENSLKTLITLSGHPSLEVLEGSANLFEQVEFDPNPPRLRALILASNSLTRFTNRTVFANLEILSLSGNQFSEFDFIPFPKLKTLNLSFNQFKTFELNSPTLVELSIQNNALETFTAVNCRCLTHLDISFNQLSDISVFDHIPTLTHLNGVGNQFETNWVSFAVNSCPKMTIINGRLLREGEMAIHRDRVARFIRSTKTPHPHKEISRIRLAFRRLKACELPPVPEGDIVDLWVGAGRREEERGKLILEEALRLPCVSTLSEDACLTVYGTPKSNEFVETDFRTLKLEYVPILKESPIETRVAELASHEPTMLTLDHNLLVTFDDCMFLTSFEFVEVLQIDGNEVSKLALFRPLVSYLMPCLQVVNGEAITTAEKRAGIQHFQGLLNACKNIIVVSGMEEETPV